MPINVADLEIHHSGGAANEAEGASIGGAISTAAGKRVLAQSATAPTNVTGVVIDDASGNPLGAGTLTYTNTGQTLQWKAQGEATGGTAVAVGTDGKYAIPAEGVGYLFVTVTAASLPGTDQNDANITIANRVNEMFDNISSAESFAGDVEYRCYYIKNTHSTDTAFGVKVWIQDQPAGADTIKLAVDTAGVNGTATTAANESTAPAGQTFSTPASQGTGLLLGDLTPGDYAAFWIERTVPAETVTKTLNDFSNIGISAYL